MLCSYDRSRQQRRKEGGRWDGHGMVLHPTVSIPVYNTHSQHATYPAPAGIVIRQESPGSWGTQAVRDSKSMVDGWLSYSISLQTFRVSGSCRSRTLGICERMKVANRKIWNCLWVISTVTPRLVILVFQMVFPSGFQ